MQKEAIQAHYQAIRDTIKANVATIRQLVQQAETLKRVVSSIQDVSQRDTITVQISGIEASTEQLITQTDKLFDQYQRFIDQVYLRH